MTLDQGKEERGVRGYYVRGWSGGLDSAEIANA